MVHRSYFVNNYVNEYFSGRRIFSMVFAYFTGGVACPHCQAGIYKGEINESGDDYIVCPHCGEKIKKDDLE